MNIKSTDLRKWLTNYKAKLFSLIFALLLWFFVVTDNHFDHTTTVAVRLINQPEGWILKKEIPSRITVLFRGSGKELLAFASRDKEIELDLRESARPRTFRLTVEMITDIPPEMAITPIRIIGTDSVHVELDRFAQKRVRVTPQMTIGPKDGYTMVGAVLLEPDSILVSGPRSVVDTVNQVNVFHREFAGLIKPISGKINFPPPDPSTIEYSESIVRFTVDIQRLGEKSVADIPVEVINIPRGFTVKVVPATFSLRLQGGVELLSRITSEDIAATIDYRSRARYRGKRIPATIVVPADIEFSNARPKDFELIVER